MKRTTSKTKRPLSLDEQNICWSFFPRISCSLTLVGFTAFKEFAVWSGYFVILSECRMVSPHQRQAAARYTREKKQETTERHLDVAKTRSAERYNYSNDHSINYTKAARHVRVSPQVNYLKCICPQWTKVEQNDFNRGFKTKGSKPPSDEKKHKL